MKSFDRMIAAAVIIMLVLAAAFNLIMTRENRARQPLYKIEINRIVQAAEHGETVRAEDYDNITGIYRYDGSSSFFDTDSEYAVREINGELYRIEYSDSKEIREQSLRRTVNIAIAAVSLLLLAFLLYIRQSIIKPFNEISGLPEQLSKGNLTMPLKERKSRYFGKFIWGLDMLRHELETSRSKELEHAKKEKTFLLSLSHDIKTPLSAVKLYAKGISSGLYSTQEKTASAAENINSKADEIENIVSELMGSLSSDFMNFEVHKSEFYLSRVMDRIEDYYRDKLTVSGTDFTIEKYRDCILSGDPDRLEEVLQNIIENAVKYGDGGSISVSFSDEEDCRLITVSNTGCTLPEQELSNVFDSFWRGSNSGSQPGSGLGLYICRRLMELMGGDIYAEVSSGCMNVTAVCRKQV